MSLDVYLMLDEVVESKLEGKIYIREDGATKEISLDEWNERNPGRNPVVVDTDKYDYSREAYEANITHNLARMASEAGLHKPLWRPDEIDITKAKQLIPLLEVGLGKLKADPEKYKQYNPSNGWGDYEGLVRFTENYLEACKEYPSATVEVSR